jgi:hypothetical protein
MKKKLAEWIWNEFAKREVMRESKELSEKQARLMIQDLVKLIIKSGEFQLNRDHWSFLSNNSVRHDLASAFQQAMDRRIDIIFKQYEEGIKNKIESYISSEEFIDKIINRINTKQLAK